MHRKYRTSKRKEITEMGDCLGAVAMKLETSGGNMGAKEGNRGSKRAYQVRDECLGSEMRK